jgi:hypothetical protein
MKIRGFTILAAIILSLWIYPAAFAFEGRIAAVTTEGGQTNALVYTVGTNFLRVELLATNWPNPVDVVDLGSGALTLFFPNNRSFVHLKPGADDAAAPASGMPMMPVPPDTGPQAQPAPPPGMPNMLAMPNMPAAPTMPIMPMPEEKLELRPTGEITNILGIPCQRYEMKQRREIMEIWATDQLVPYQPYVRNQRHRFGPRRMEEQWPVLLASSKLFPLLATLRYENGPERFHFEVTSVAPEKLSVADTQLFQPPSGYVEIQPLPF